MTRDEWRMQLMILTHEETDAEHYNAALHKIEDCDAGQREEIKRLTNEVKLWMGYRDDQLIKKRRISESFGKLCRAQRATRNELAGRVQRIERQDEEIRLLSEQVNAANQELLRRPVDQGKDLAQLQHAYQLLADAHEKQSKEITRLRVALEFIAGEASWLSEAEAVANKALTQEPT